MTPLVSTPTDLIKCHLDSPATLCSFLSTQMSLGYLEQHNEASMYEMKATQNIKASNTMPPPKDSKY